MEQFKCTPQTFDRLHWCAIESFYVSRRNKGTVRYRRMPAMEEAVINTVENGPLTSSRSIGRTLGVSDFPC